jgi:hypothetical protein
MIVFSEVYVFSDQPTICPNCSSRTELMLDLSHTKDKTEIHKCLNIICKFEFATQSDEEIEKYSL